MFAYTFENPVQCAHPQLNFVWRIAQNSKPSIATIYTQVTKLQLQLSRNLDVINIIDSSWDAYAAKSNSVFQSISNFPLTLCLFLRKTSKLIPWYSLVTGFAYKTLIKLPSFLLSVITWNNLIHNFWKAKNISSPFFSTYWVKTYFLY